MRTRLHIQQIASMKQCRLVYLDGNEMRILIEHMLVEELDMLND